MQSNESHDEVMDNVNIGTCNSHNLGNRLHGQFLTTDKLLEVLSINNSIVLAELPRTEKSDVYFILDNTCNMDKKVQRKRMVFWDNCGTWDTKLNSTKTTYFIMSSDGRLVSCLKKQDQYCIEIKRKFISLDPQPSQSNIYILKRYYATLKRDKNYKKRVSWFQQIPGIAQELLFTAVAEYLGMYPANVSNIHGSSKSTNQEYTRTSPGTKEYVKFGLEHGKTVRQVFNENFR